MPSADELIDRPFQPSAIYYPDGDYTEIVTSDAPVVWSVADGRLVYVAFDMETGELVAVRLSGDVTKLRRFVVAIKHST